MKFCPFDEEKNRNDSRKHVHDIQDWLSYKYDWKYPKIYCTQVYIHLLKIINMTTTDGRKMFEVNDP